MRTISDLHAVFEDLEDQAPQALSHEPSITVRRRSRTVPMVAAAAAVAALAAATPWLAGRLTERTSPGPATHLQVPAPAGQVEIVPPCTRTSQADRVRLRTTWQFVESAGIDLTGAIVCADSQRAYLNVGGRTVGQLIVYPAGGFDAQYAVQGSPVEINGAPGYLVRLANQFGTEGSALFDCVQHAAPTTCPAPPPATDEDLLTSVAFRYAPNAYAVMQSFEPSEAVDLLLSRTRALQLGVLVPLRVPFQIGYLPDGLYPIAAQDGVALDFADPALAGAGITFPTKQIHGLEVGLAPATTPLEVTADTDPITVSGHAGRVAKNNTRIGWIAGGYEFWVRTGPDHTYDRMDLLKVAQSITLPPGGSTADEAVPIGHRA